MDKLNETFRHDIFEITTRFTPEDRYGVDRHSIFIHRPCCPVFKAQSFDKNGEEIREYAKALTGFVTPTCG